MPWLPTDPKQRRAVLQGLAGWVVVVLLAAVVAKLILGNES